MAMAYLRPIRYVPPTAEPEHPCIAAFDRELDYILATLRRLGAKPADVEDLAQEVFLVLLKNWAIIDAARPLRHYLFGVAFRMVRAHRRRLRRESLFEPGDVEDSAVTPEAAVQGKESTSLLLAALERVPLARRAVIVMHDLDDIPIKEVGRRLSMSKFGTYARLRKGRKELKAAVRRLSKKQKAQP